MREVTFRKKACAECGAKFVPTGGRAPSIALRVLVMLCGGRPQTECGDAEKERENTRRNPRR